MFKDNLKNARKKAKLTQEKVAEVINTARSNISKYENGNLEPNLATLKLLCQLYKVSADELLEINLSEKQSDIKELRFVNKKEENEIYIRKE